MGGTKKSSLAYQARADERKTIVEASAKRRAENTARIAKLRRNASSGFGQDMTGRFE
jgi:mediator of replication checkpoint protein 1